MKLDRRPLAALGGLAGAMALALPLPARAAANADPPFAVDATDDGQFVPAIASDPTYRRYLVVWHDSAAGVPRVVRGAFVQDGETTASPFTVSSGSTDRAQPAVALDGVLRDYLIVWSQDFSGDGSDWDLWGRFVPADGPIGAESSIPIDSGAASQLEPAVAYSAGRFLVVWSDLPSAGAASIRARLVKADGSGFVGTSFDVSSSATPCLVPDVAFDQDRDRFLVVWQQGTPDSDIYGAFVTTEGAIVAPGPFAIAAYVGIEEAPSIDHCLGIDQYLVAWQSLPPPDGLDYAIYARRIDGDGTIVGAPIALLDTTGDEKRPSVACRLSGFGGDDYLVAYEQQYGDLAGPTGVWAQMVRWDGTTRPPFGIVAPAATAERTRPAIAPLSGWTDQRNAVFLVAWQHERSGTTYQDIWAAYTHPQVIFGDGFDLGDTGAWSEVVPP